MGWVFSYPTQLFYILVNVRFYYLIVTHIRLLLGSFTHGYPNRTRTRFWVLFIYNNFKILGILNKILPFSLVLRYNYHVFQKKKNTITITNLNNNKNTIVTGCGRYTCKCYVTKLNNCVVCPKCVTIVRNQKNI